MKTVSADVVIVGSGAGGGTVAQALSSLASAGKRVLVLERGPRFRDEEFNGRHSVKVVWIGKKSDPNLSRGAARFFGAPIGEDGTHGLDAPF